MKSKFEEFVAEKRAVSPVIGVVLMVAVVVILAAVIGAFVLGLGGDQQNTPQAAFNYDEDAQTVTMASGEPIPGDQLSVEGQSFAASGDGGTVIAGDAATGVTDANTDGQIDVIWTSPNGDSAILTSFDVGGDAADGGAG